jgi:ATP-binding protein involved in chromosome partitioning
VNLAVSLARQGLKTALVDADLYGPSIPMMLGVQNEHPSGEVKDGKETMYPVEKFGIKLMSIGFFISKGQPVIWRGPMASNGLTQLFRDTEWGEIDYMIVDFPPGTGDIQLTTVQKLNLAGVIIVTTPQEVALSDARWFTPANHPDEKYYIFGKGGGEKLAGEFNTRLLGKIPLVLEIGDVSDRGLTIYNQPDKNVTEAFEKISNSIYELTEVHL